MLYDYLKWRMVMLEKRGGVQRHTDTDNFETLRGGEHRCMVTGMFKLVGDWWAVSDYDVSIDTERKGYVILSVGELT